MSDEYKQFDLVYVEWIDSATPDAGWKIFDDWNFSAVLCQTVGWLVSSTDQELVITGTIGRDNDREKPPNQGLGFISIPKVAVQRIRPLLVQERPSDAVSADRQ